jgi:hypothetical protein
MNLHNDLVAWSSAIKRGTWAEWPTYNPPAQPNVSSSTSLINAPTKRAMDYLNEAYDLLGLSDDEPLNLETLKIAYKKRAVIFHPDKGGDPAVFDDLTKAYLYLQEVYKKLIPKAGRDHADSTPVTMEAAKARRVDNTIQSFDDEDKKISKLIVFDDFICLAKKQMKILEDYAISSRKFGFTTVYISQNYTSVPKIISRNCNYIFCFKINDKVSIKRIISNHGLSDHYSPEQIEKYYHYCIAQHLGFLLIDLRVNDPSKVLRCGFTEFF